MKSYNDSFMSHYEPIVVAPCLIGKHRLLLPTPGSAWRGGLLAGHTVGRIRQCERSRLRAAGSLRGPCLAAAGAAVVRGGIIPLGPPVGHVVYSTFASRHSSRVHLR